MKHKAGLTISRPPYGDGSRKISIQVKDRDASIKFLELEVDYDKFAECLTGLAEVDCEIKVNKIENVGKVIERKKIEFEIPGPEYEVSDEIMKRLAPENTPDGWECSVYFNSQDSFFKKDGKEYARTHISRWIDK